MMHKFSKTGEYAKKRLKIALAEDRSTISASDNMTQIKKEIKSVIQRLSLIHISEPTRH